MRRQAVGAVALAVLFASLEHAAGGRITGVLASVERDSAPTLQDVVEARR
jgi:hypothetical protein